MITTVNMSEILNEIRTEVGAENLSPLRRRSGCGVDMTDAPSPRVVIDADLAFPAHEMTGKRCDYVIFFDDTAENSFVAVLIELKGRAVKASEVFEQLQGGANFVARFTAAITETVCFPILFQKGIHPAEFKRLKNFRVRFHNKNLPIRVTSCGSPLTQALSKKSSR